MSRSLACPLPLRTLVKFIARPQQIAAPCAWRRAFSSESDAPPTNPLRPMRTLSSMLGDVRTTNAPSIDDQALDANNISSLNEEKSAEKSEDELEPYHFHVYSHKHNTHVTVTTPNRDPIVSLSSGNLGFKKSARSQYDAAYQLGALVMDRLHQKGMHQQINNLEVVMRGFGPGREALTKILLGNEGRLFRSKIIRVADSTRIKFGGTRSKKPRRLG